MEILVIICDLHERGPLKVYKDGFLVTSSFVSDTEYWEIEARMQPLAGSLLSFVLSKAYQEDRKIENALMSEGTAIYTLKK